MTRTIEIQKKMKGAVDDLIQQMNVRRSQEIEGVITFRDDASPCCLGQQARPLYWPIWPALNGLTRLR